MGRRTINIAIAISKYGCKGNLLLSVCMYSPERSLNDKLIFSLKTTFFKYIYIFWDHLNIQFFTKYRLFVNLIGQKAVISFLKKIFVII